MADVDDVLKSLAQLAASVLYPGSSPSGLPSPVAGAVCKIYPGWPAADQLDKDLKSGDDTTPGSRVVNVSVFPLQGMENVTRYPQDWIVAAPAVTTLTATVDDSANPFTVTIAGTVSVPQNVALIVNGYAYVYQVQATDTLDDIAAGLAALLQNLAYLGLSTADGFPIQIENPPSSNGPVVIIPQAFRVVARVGGAGTGIREVGRVRQRFQITTWAPTPQLRAKVAPAIKAAIMATNFLTMPDNYAARLLLTGDTFMDKWEKQLVYRRDLLCSVEYATTQTEQETEIIVVQVPLTAGQDGAENAGTFNY